MNQNDKVDKKIKVIIWIVMLLFLVIYYGSLAMMVIGTFSNNRGACWLRYNEQANGVLTTDTLSMVQSVTLNATGNYSISDAVYNPETGQTTIPSDTSDGSYGNWYNAGTIQSNSVSIEVNGTISLCKSSIPRYHLQSSTNPEIEYLTSTPGERSSIIPKVGDTSSIALRFPSNTGKWKNALEVFEGDNVQLLVAPALTPSSPPLGAINPTNLNVVVMKDLFTNDNTAPVSCTNNVMPPAVASNTAALNTAHAMCGRFTPYANIEYPTGCETKNELTCGSYTCSKTCACGGYTSWGCVTNVRYTRKNAAGTGCEDAGGGSCWCKSKPQSPSDAASWSTVYYPEYASTPAPFIYPTSSSNGNLIDGSNTFMYSANVNDYLKKAVYQSPTCVNENSDATIKSAVANYKFWFTEGRGLVMRFGEVSSAEPGRVSSSDSGVITLPKAWPTREPNSIDGGRSRPPGKILFSETITAEMMGGSLRRMLQLGYIDEGNPAAENFGGYVIYLNHTKCNRTGGKFASDTFEARGRIDYYLAPPEYDLNKITSANMAYLQSGYLDFNNSGRVTLNVNSPGQLNLWLRINNAPGDYKNSSGEYKIKIGQLQQVGIFTGKVLQPIMNKVDNIIEESGAKVFKSLTCYGSDQGKCRDFFLYIRSLLTLYIFVIGSMFLLGKVQMDQKEFITHALKIIFIGGLLNGSTFEFLNKNVFPLVISFSDAIIGNFGGYSQEHPFTFLDEAMSKLIFNKLALFQMFGLISSGIAGIAMFIIAGIAIIIFVVTVFQAIATYIFAKLLVAFLIGISPLFLTFMLFETTRTYFQKWLNNLVRYMVEPIIVIMGLAVFTQLFTVYLDRLLGYSVCYKCAIPFKIPNIIGNFIEGFPQAFLDKVIFCFYWFTPWGVDSRSGIISLSFPDAIGLGIIAFMNYKYVEFSSSIVSALTTISNTSASQMGSEAGKAVAGGFSDQGYSFGANVLRQMNQKAKAKRDQAKQDKRKSEISDKKSLDQGKSTTKAANSLSTEKLKENESTSKSRWAFAKKSPSASSLDSSGDTAVGTKLGVAGSSDSLPETKLNIDRSVSTPGRDNASVSGDSSGTVKAGKMGSSESSPSGTSSTSGNSFANTSTTIDAEQVTPKTDKSSSEIFNQIDSKKDKKSFAPIRPRGGPKK